MLIDLLLLSSIVCFYNDAVAPITNQNTSMVYDNDEFCRWEKSLAVSSISDEDNFHFRYRANPDIEIFTLNIEKGEDSLVFFLSNTNNQPFNLTCDLTISLNNDTMNGYHNVFNFAYMVYDYSNPIKQLYFDYPTDTLNIRADFSLMSEEEYNHVTSLYNAGYNSGHDAGYQTGYTAGESSGYQQGYSAGLGEASSQTSTALTIFSGIVEVGLLPVNVFLQFFNFEVFGINISALVMSIMTIAITIIVIRMVTGKKDD